MATIPKETIKAAPKAAKKTSTITTAKKIVAAKSKDESIPTQDPAQVEGDKSTSSASKAKSHHPPEIVEQEIVPKPAVESTPPRTAQDVPQDQKWQEIRVILEKLKEDTLREIRKSVKSGTEAVAAIEPSGDIYDQASSERDRELGLLLGDREREKIHSIDEALLRISEGDYGICEECDEDIPLGRLKAMPFARHCVKCKTDLEKMQAQTKRVEEERAYREIPMGSEEEE
ncbi:MAG: TraR/DksA family transcriptional regulator [Desulfuromonadaceae bacterium]|nr:TraR/DksA family transcriptional regulator [Desulfuromonadaceae bacterium]